MKNATHPNTRTGAGDEWLRWNNTGMDRTLARTAHLTLRDLFPHRPVRVVVNDGPTVVYEV